MSDSGDGAGVGPCELGAWYAKPVCANSAAYGGDAWFEAGGEGSEIGSCSDDAGGRIGAGRLWTGCGRVARSKNEAYLPSNDCHFDQSSTSVKRLYFMLLRNSTSMMWTSATLIPDTSAQVLFVYVLSSRNLLPNIRATVKSLYSLPGLPLTAGLSFFKRYTNRRARRTTFWATSVVDNIVVTHLRKPVVGVASLHNFLEGCNVIGEFSISSSRSDDSNQNRHVIWHFVSMLFAFFFFEYLQPTSAASSDRLPPLSFTDEGIWNEGAIKLSFGFCDLD